MDRVFRPSLQPSLRVMDPVFPPGCTPKVLPTVIPDHLVVRCKDQVKVLIPACAPLCQLCVVEHNERPCVGKVYRPPKARPTARSTLRRCKARPCMVALPRGNFKAVDGRLSRGVAPPRAILTYVVAFFHAYTIPPRLSQNASIVSFCVSVISGHFTFPCIFSHDCRHISSEPKS